MAGEVSKYRDIGRYVYCVMKNEGGRDNGWWRWERKGRVFNVLVACKHGAKADAWRRGLDATTRLSQATFQKKFMTTPSPFPRH
jgi:hypothetical protein